MFIVSHAFVDVAGKQMKYIVIVLLTMLKKTNHDVQNVFSVRNEP